MDFGKSELNAVTTSFDYSDSWATITQLFLTMLFKRKRKKLRRKKYKLQKPEKGTSLIEVKEVSDLNKYVLKRKTKDKAFAKNYESGYAELKLGVMLRQARESAGLTQAELAIKLKTKKSAISRIENHAEDIRLSTLEKVAEALGKTLNLSIS